MITTISDKEISDKQMSKEDERIYVDVEHVSKKIIYL